MLNSLPSMMEILFLHEIIWTASDKTCLLFQRVKKTTVQLMLMVLSSVTWWAFPSWPAFPSLLNWSCNKKRLKNCTSKAAEDHSWLLCLGKKYTLVLCSPEIHRGDDFPAPEWTWQGLRLLWIIPDWLREEQGSVRFFFTSLNSSNICSAKSWCS